MAVYTTIADGLDWDAVLLLVHDGPLSEDHEAVCELVDAAIDATWDERDRETACPGGFDAAKIYSFTGDIRAAAVDLDDYAVLDLRK